MIPLFYYKAGADALGKPVKLMMDAMFGRVINVADGVNPITPDMIAGVGSRICILPLDRKSELSLYAVIQPMDGIEFFIQHVFNRDDGLTAAESLEAYYTKRHGRRMLIPHSKSIRECDVLNAAVKKWGMRHDTEFASKCSMAYTEPNEGKCSVLITYTSPAGRDYDTKLDYPVEC